MMNDKFDMNVMDEVGVEEVYMEGYDEWLDEVGMRDCMMEVNEELDKDKKD